MKVPVNKKLIKYDALLFDKLPYSMKDYIMKSQVSYAYGMSQKIENYHNFLILL